MKNSIINIDSNSQKYLKELISRMEERCDCELYAITGEKRLLLVSSSNLLFEFVGGNIVMSGNNGFANIRREHMKNISKIECYGKAAYKVNTGFAEYEIKFKN